MIRPTLEPFTAEYLPAAAGLLARRVAQWRHEDPLLPASFETLETAESAITALLAAPEANGVAAFGDGQLVGYLIGSARPDWAVANAWIAAEGVAATDPSIIPIMYAAAAQSWVDDGRLAHHVLVPAVDSAAREVWHRLDFGIQHVHAATTLPAPMPPSSDVVIRPAVADDARAGAPFDVQFAQHLNAAPVWSGVAVPTLAEAEQEWRETLADDSIVTFVAEVAGEVIGAAVGCAIDKSSAHAGLARFPDAGMLAWITVDAKHRGLGHSAPLAAAVLDWLHRAGHDTAVTDWRATNIESAAAWRRFGFHDTFYRLHRVVR